uniref:Uncharacterized protein n=2 Tax=Aegilops tauschii subsp. strangulata TaxID=200361 RepID=A0A453MNX2_AEGTS
MGKHAIRMLALAALVSLHLVCSASVAQCRTMNGMDSKKINIPYGLCIHVADTKLCGSNGCFHCLTNDVLYPSMDRCTRACKTSSSLQDVLVAMRTSPPRPLHAP